MAAWRFLQGEGELEHFDEDLRWDDGGGDRLATTGGFIG
jgi:hypothetical protein